MALEIATANRLGDGRSVYLGASGWSLRVADAVVARSAEAAKALLAAAEAAAARNEIVAPYLIEVAEVDGRPAPVRYRERIRAEGPTVAHGSKETV